MKEKKYHAHTEPNNDNPLEEIATIIAFDSRDYSTHYRDAMLYAIACGWDKSSYDEFRKKFGWTDETVTRLKQLHKIFEKTWIAIQL